MNLSRFITEDSRIRKLELRLLALESKVEALSEAFSDEEQTVELPHCPGCGSREVEDWDAGAHFYLTHPLAPITDMHCLECGKCFNK